MRRTPRRIPEHLVPLARSRGGALAGHPRYPRRQPRCPAPRGSIVTFTSSFLPRRAASAGKMIEDTCQKAVGAAGRPGRVARCPGPVPIKAARTTFNILRLTEELLEEVVFLLRSMRPVVGAVSTAQQADNFDTVFRTLEQIQNSARTPIGVGGSGLAPV